MLVPRSMMIKPASGACNLACEYCFYLDETTHRSSAVRPFMSLSTMRAVVAKALEGASRISFAFQGGEPSLVGLPWFETFVHLVEELNVSRIPVSYAFQTNGTLLDYDWGKFFHQHTFLVGISCDGFAQSHNLYRRNHDKTRSSSQVFRGIEAMQRCHVDLNVLTVVTNAVADNIDAIWEFFIARDLRYQQYIACLDPLKGTDNRFLDPKVYGSFLIKLFDKWVDSLNSTKPVSIRLFDNFLGIFMGYPPEACDMNGRCSVQYVIESDGTVYPCDFYCLDSHELGNINEMTIAQLDEVRDAINFLHEADDAPAKCQACPIFALCRAGCKRNRLPDGTFRFCESYKMLFSQRGAIFQRLAEELKRQGS